MVLISISEGISWFCLLPSGYTGKKFEDNLNCEIFGTIHEEAVDSYRKDIVHELSSNSPEEMESNLERIVQWIEQWKQNTS